MEEFTVTTENDGKDILKLSKTYQFEGEEISELDMSGVENLTVNDLVRAQKIFSHSGRVSGTPEMDIEYLMILAARATGRPIEFFRRLNAKDGIRVKNKITANFYSAG